MKNNDRAANVVKLAQSLDLQLFNDDLLDPIDPAATIEQDPFEPEEPADPPADPISSDPVDPPTPEDITQTQAFARRLKEETERATERVRQEARDAFVAEQYAGVEWNGKPITTEAELQQALFEQELQNAGAEDIDRIINEHPDVKAARLQREAQQRQQAIYNEWSELHEEYPEISDFSKIPPEVYALKDQKGISLLDAYNRIHVKKVRIETEQETIRKINQNAASSPGSVMDDGVVHKTKSVDEMTPEEFEAYREEVRRKTRGE